MDDMTLWQAIVLGLTQGLAEFLPVSSSGHLVLLREIMNINGEYLLFDVMLHVGTLFAIFVVFFKDLLALFKPPFKTIGLIILASVPAVLVGLLLNDYIEALFSAGKYRCFFFLFTAALMLATEIISKKTKETKPLGVKTAVFMGLMQGVGVFPGVSRSGSTIFGGVAAKTERTEVAKFSFFMSIPVILGSAVLELFKADFAVVNWLNIVVGMLVSFISGLFAIKLMLRVIQKANYKWFGLYLLVVSVLSFVFLFLGI